MKPYIRDVSVGERPSADWSNEIRDAACRDITGPVAHSGWGGTALPYYAGMEVSLYELTSDPELDDKQREYKAQAKSCLPLLVSVDGDGHYAGDATAESRVCRYRMMTKQREETIWFPAGNRDDNAEAKEKPPEVTGSRVWTTVSYGQRVVLGQAGYASQYFNDSDETVPAFAVMAVTGVHTLDSGEILIKIAKPSATFCKEYIVNGSAEVASKAIGTYQEGPEVIVAYDTGTPSANDNYGPKAGQWTATAARQAGADDYYQLFTVHGIKDATAKTAIATMRQIGPPWHPYVNATNPNATIPAYGVFTATSPSGFSPDYKVAIAGANHTTLLYSSQFRINGPNAVAYHGFGWCQAANDDYITALFAIGLGLTPDFNWLAGTSCGPLPGQNDYKLWPHLPGFKFLTATGTNGLGHVLKDDKDIYYAKATADWTSYSTDCGYVAANPCNSTGSVVYNGAGNYPSCTINIALPVRGNSKTPAVFSGDVIPYRIWNGATPLGSAVATPFVAYGDFVDDKIGTVKMWIGTVANIPKGWRVYTAMLERFPVGVYENSDWVPTVGTTGGTLTHTHGTDEGSGAGTSAEASLASANHLPPFCGVIFIERYK